ncbi:hypothetical protein RhiXN_07508 [Rhizoctonia solani]|uniref:Uncharacterized protein n=1 Tax=Rhizoctonia solani TaxID=456999 RepID=A0A8H8T188_9AGAM|nr:uncharacterized protein RhiXN_07508 [Rhizoctonia solani]QRW25559.1 hypothetical protein RhiXN_07508 [Rhizoctonia solani]
MGLLRSDEVPGADIGRALADLNAACQPIGHANFQGDEIVESPLVVPESTPVAVLSSGVDLMNSDQRDMSPICRRPMAV